MPSVFPASSMPSHLLRSQRPAVSALCAWGTLRAMDKISAMVCSAAESTLDCGALTTITPCLVAASTSMLSSPTPARATTTNCLPAANIAASTMVAERTMRACAPSRIACNSPADLFSCTSTIKPADRSRSRPASAISSAITIRLLMTAAPLHSRCTQ